MNMLFFTLKRENLNFKDLKQFLYEGVRFHEGMYTHGEVRVQYENSVYEMKTECHYSDVYGV